MKLEIEERKDNPLLRRVELRILVDHEKEPTPKKQAIHDALVKELGEVKENVEISKIFSHKGVCKSRAWAIVKKAQMVIEDLEPLQTMKEEEEGPAGQAEEPDEPEEDEGEEKIAVKKPKKKAAKKKPAKAKAKGKKAKK